MDQEIADELDLNGISQPLCLKWTGDMHRTENSSQLVNVKIAGPNQREISINIHTVYKLSLPMQTLNYEKLSERYHHMRNLPISSYNDAVPRLLIGVDHWKLGLPQTIKEGQINEPIAVKTLLGWHIYGTVGESKVMREYQHFHICECSQQNDIDLHDMVKKYYSFENLGITSTQKPLASTEDERALNLLQKYTRQTANGHFETCLLWRFESFQLPDSYEMAKHRLRCLEKKLKSEPQLQEIFHNTISEYLKKGYIRKLTNTEMSQNKQQRIWHLPIFAVFNKNKPGKARVVWDAAAKSKGVSLNTFLLKGPDLLASLPAILHRFRQKSVAISADIQEMFHQVLIRSEDQNAQRFLWSGGDVSTEPDIYVMNVMIFGAACSPCTSQYIKNFNAERFKISHAQAVEAVKNNHYVDDYLDSVDTDSEAIKLAQDVKYIHKEGGFNIRNWCSNAGAVLNALGEPGHNNKIDISGDSSAEKILGIFWIPSEDVITFKLSPLLWQRDIFNGRKTPTKREMLSIVMSIYDPLGLVSNILIYGKILLQSVWRSAVNWDDEITSDLAKKWFQWLNELPNLENIKIPRCYLKSHANYDGADVQLHTFVDASDIAYAAVCYMRISKNDIIECSLIASKTRVAPLKQVSIPRLELMAALIGARLAHFLIESHSIKINRKIFWSDAKTVLSWLHSNSRRYHQFVAVRVGEILETTELHEWKWISTKLNVADESTKLHKKSVSSPCSRWLNGPGFLQRPECEWPIEEDNLEITNVELKKYVLNTTTTKTLIDANRFSKWSRIQRTSAYVIRYIQNLRRKLLRQEMLLGELTQAELENADFLLYRQAQSEAYSDEIITLKNQQRLSKSSSLYKLTPFLDTNCVLRADSRIVTVIGERQHPVILPKNDRISSLIVNHFHRKFHHLNNETTVNELRQYFYIPRLRATVKAILKACQSCKISKAMPRAPIMARLPQARITPYVVPFTYTGLDFFGPIYVTVNRHKEKRYGALFTCLTVRAVHVEIVHSLTSSSCILAIRNFVARRGTPREFYSDNATNFVGAERELREALAIVDKNMLIRNFTTSTTSWNFIPPAAPHMGGAWERLVRSIKTVFYKITPTRAPSDELLYSMMAEVENVVNSRPLSYIPIENDQAEALTPNHFLLGCSNGMKPIATFDDNSYILRNTWLTAQQYAQHFWERWIKEYLPCLTHRTKWHEKEKAICVGDLVVIVDPGSPRNVWLRGRVLRTKVAADGQVRSATVQTTQGVLERPAIKLAILNVANEKE